jgi:hypothetical protein
MRHTVRLDRPPTTESNLDFRWACYTALFMLVLLSTGLVVTAFFTAHRVHEVHFSTDWPSVWQNHGSYVALLAVFGYTVVSWLFILAWIHAYWPDGWIWRRRIKKRQNVGGSDEMGPPIELLEGAQSMGVGEPAPAHVKDENRDVEDIIEMYRR